MCTRSSYFGTAAATTLATSVCGRRGRTCFLLSAKRTAIDRVARRRLTLALASCSSRERSSYFWITCGFSPVASEPLSRAHADAGTDATCIRSRASPEARAGRRRINSSVCCDCVPFSSGRYGRLARTHVGAGACFGSGADCYRH